MEKTNMSNTTVKKLESVQAEIDHLTNRKKQLLQKQRSEDRRIRTHRLCKRGGYLESKLPGYSSMSDEQFFSFVETQLLPWYTSQIVN